LKSWFHRAYNWLFSKCYFSSYRRAIKTKLCKFDSPDQEQQLLLNFKLASSKLRNLLCSKLVSFFWRSLGYRHCIMKKNEMLHFVIFALFIYHLLFFLKKSSRLSYHRRCCQFVLSKSKIITLFLFLFLFLFISFLFFSFLSFLFF